MRPIDADFLKWKFQNVQCGGTMKPVEDAIRKMVVGVIDDAPTITTEKLKGMKDKLIERICENCDTPPETRLRLCGECPIISPIREAFDEWNS